MSPEIQITCDGSSLGNGQAVVTRAACAALLTDSVHWRAVGEFLGSMTNQQAELMAASLALEALRFPSQVTLRSDSAYLIRTMRGEYRRRANHEYWRRLDQAAQRHHQVTWLWTRGHAGDPVQILCDRAARSIAGEPLSAEATLQSILRAARALSRQH
jgi:ribonuclease HI